MTTATVGARLELKSDVLYTATSGGAFVSIDQNGLTRVNTEIVDMTKKERDYLLLLAKGGGQILTPRMLLSGLYPEGNEPEVRILNVFTCKIRRKLYSVHEDAATVIRHVWGRGYAFGKPSKEPKPVPKFLPNPERFWVISRKIVVVLSVEKSRVTLDDLFTYYPDLSTNELAEWGLYYQNYGGNGLKATKVKVYTL